MESLNLFIDGWCILFVHFLPGGLSIQDRFHGLDTIDAGSVMDLGGIRGVRLVGRFG